MTNPINRFIEQQGFLVLDGGLATELEVRGADLGHELWSAKVLLEDQELIQCVHRDYLRAGADCIATASYQATLPGLMRHGLTEAEANELLCQSVELALNSRQRFWSDPANRAGRLRPLVAASVGPYGAYLADGSEYTGDYGLDEDDLYEFHRCRWQLLAQAGADLIACETIPSHSEARAIVRLLEETPGRPTAWISFNCCDQTHIADGSPLAEVVREFAAVEELGAIGVNCTPPSTVSGLIKCLTGVTNKPIMVYPNSGEGWDAGRKAWIGLAEPVDFSKLAGEWRTLGASCIGGCCRTGPEHVRIIRQVLTEVQRQV
ncbi:MAG: homocysteine S-methyltransferase [Gemmatimonadota bacterium]|nr:MAG: homocysteine S-methyltransferase [Gemmatimonadota bacterium]